MLAQGQNFTVGLKLDRADFRHTVRTFAIHIYLRREAEVVRCVKVDHPFHSRAMQNAQALLVGA